MDLAYIAAIGVLDYFTPINVNFTLFYVLGVAFAGWGAGKWPAIGFACLGTASAVVSQFNSFHGPQDIWPLLWNASSQLIVFSAGGWLTARATQLTCHLEQLAEQRAEQWKQEAEQHKTTAAKLAETLERFEQVTNNISEVFWLADVPRSQIFYASPAYERISGRTRDELHRNPNVWLAAVHPGDLSKVKERPLTSEGAFDLEFRIIRPDGEVRWIRDRAFPVRNQSGEIYRVAGIAEDITERKQAEERLADAQELNQKMLAASPMGIVAYKATGECVFCNEALARIAGGTVEQILQGNFRKLESWRKSGLLRLAEDALKENQAQSGEFYDVTRFGKAGYVDAHTAPFVSGGELHVLHMSYDISERKRLESQLLEISDREQARIGQDIHDGLCQKLVSLAFDANLLQRKLAAKKRPEAAAADRIANLLDESITESRQLSRGLFPIRLQTQGLVPALEELAQSASERFRLSCRFQTDATELSLPQAIATQLYRIAQEAVNNAARHSQPREISIELSSQNGEVTLTIKDDGHGLKPEARENGNGMGLHIMDYRARAIRGVLELESSETGGTRVSCCVSNPVA